MPDRRALCRDLRTTAESLGVIIDALGIEDTEQAEWMTHNLAATAATMIDYADGIEEELLSR